MQYEYLFMDRKRIGSNIEAIMKDRKCTKVTLSQAMNISRPTLDAFLKGDIHKSNDYYEMNMNVQAGTKFEEISNKYGDYVVMDENCVLSVYDKNDNKVGSVQFKDYGQIEEDRKEAGPVAMGALGTILVGGGAAVVKDIIKNKKGG